MINKLSFSLFALTAIIFFSFTGISTTLTNFKVDTKKSKLNWIGKKVTGEHTGDISISSGILVVDGKLVKSGTFDIDMKSITVTDLKDSTYNQKLLGHLKSEDFFNIEKHSKANFVISKVTPKSGNDYDVSGKLTIKNITHDITFPATITSTATNLTAVAKIVVDRTKYDIKYGSGSFFDNLGDKAIDNDFILNLNLVASK